MRERPYIIKSRCPKTAEPLQIRLTQVFHPELGVIYYATSESLAYQAAYYFFKMGKSVTVNYDGLSQLWYVSDDD